MRLLPENNSTIAIAVKVSAMERAINNVAVTNDLLMYLKVNATIDWYRYLLCNLLHKMGLS